MDHVVKPKEMKKEFIIRQVTPADIKGLFQLYEEVWPDVSYDKMAKTNFVLNESKGYNLCAEKNGEIVSSRLSYYLNFYSGNNHLKCIQLCDSCTRKDCRGKGIFFHFYKSLLNLFYNNDKNGIIWNISADASRRVHEKYGWNYIKSFATMLKICRPYHIISKIGFKISKLFGVVNWDLDDDYKTINQDHLFAREKIMREKNLLHVNYDNRTINWRMKTHSGIKSYDTNDGTIYFKLGNKNGLKFILIGEIFLSNYKYSIFKRLIKTFIKNYNPDLIKLAISEGHPLVPFYKKSGFFYNPKNKYLNHGVRVESDEMKLKCYEPKNWAISMLDIDTF